MNARAINAAAGVILAAIQQGRVPAGIATALDSAGLLMSPDTAAELRWLRAQVDDLTAEHATTRPADEDPIAYALTSKAVESANGPTGRTAQLLDAIRAHRGEWTTGRVQELYRSPGFDAPQRGTARRDLHTLHAMGHLVEHDMKGRRFYTLNSRKGGRS
ncbi:hypothetical protein [Streptomyces sp. NPDC003032]